MSKADAKDHRFNLCARVAPFAIRIRTLGIDKIIWINMLMGSLSRPDFGRNTQRILFVFVLCFLTASCGRFSLDYEGEDRITIYEGDILVASGDSGLYNSFTQDRNGGIHVVYYQIPLATILWSYSPNIKRGFEKTEVVAQAGVGDNFGLSAKVLVDSSNTPHVIYIRHLESGTSSFRIYHSRREDEGKWASNQVHTCALESRAEILDAVIDPEDVIHVVYVGADKKLYYTAFRINGENISCELVDPAVGEPARVPFGGAISGCVDVAIDGAGTIHVAYYDSENGNTKYAFKKRGEPGWNVSVIGWKKVHNEEIKFTQITPGEYTADLQFPSNEAKADTYIFAIGPGGRKEVPKEFWKFRGQKTIVLSGNIIGPDKELNLNMKYYISYVRTDTSPEDDGMFCAISYNEMMVPMIAFYNSTDMKVMFSQKKGDIWEIEEIEQATVSGKINMVNVRLEDRIIPAIVFSDPLRNVVRLVIRNPSPSSDKDRWFKNTILSQRSAGYHLFSSFMPAYGKIGLTYVKLVKDSFELYFSVFDIVKEIKEKIREGS